MVQQTEWTLVPQVLQPVWDLWHKPMLDLFATRFNFRLPLYVSPVPDPSAWAIDALSIPWKGVIGYACLPSSSLGGKGLKEGTRRQRLPNSSGPSLARPTVVPRSAVSVPRSATQAVCRTSVYAATTVRNSSRESRHAGSTRIAAVQCCLQSLGASGQTISLVEEAHRPGTRSVYSSHWERWISWCDTSEADSHHPTSVQLATFLAHLSSALHLSASSVKVYRAAVCSTLRQMGARPSQMTLCSGM